MKKENRFNLALDDEETAVLDKLATQLDRRRTDVLRDALKAYGKQHLRPSSSWHTRMSPEWELRDGFWVNRLDERLWLNRFTAERLERQDLTPSEAIEIAEEINRRDSQ